MHDAAKIVEAFPGLLMIPDHSAKWLLVRAGLARP
jgi:hypothetical protein